jgi:D-alanyl-D-alanine carboxypeptidase/D-alanyl-D-alanine-endopeptidase (penicillin-binding protein 4)
MKLLTTFAALDLLGPAYTWRTEARALGPLHDGVLEGDLWLRGGGDPKLGVERFWLLLRELRAKGVREIRGDLVLDRSAHAVLDADSGRFDGEPLRPYNVAPDPLLLNFKSLRLLLVPQPLAAGVTVLPEPLPAQIDLINLIRPGEGGCADWREQLRADLSPHGGRARLILTGSYPLACGEREWHVAVLGHADYVYGVFRQLWQELGGSLAGGLRLEPVPAGSAVLASLESAPLAELVRDVNKFSNNVMARHLFLTIGAEHGRRAARAEDADVAIRAWLARRGIAMPELVLENGAGLSRVERISADGLARLLGAAWRSPLMPEFVSSLPLAGIDGTMRKRLNGNGVAGRAHVKTGSLEGVKAIGGYLLDRAGKHYIVVFLVNHPNAAAAGAAQDALLEWVWGSSGR